MECLHLKNAGFWKLKENNSEKTSKQETSFNLKFRSLQARAPSTKDEILFSHCFVWYLKISKLTLFCQWYVSITNYETVFFFLGNNFFNHLIYSSNNSYIIWRGHVCLLQQIFNLGQTNAYYVTGQSSQALHLQPPSFPKNPYVILHSKYNSPFSLTLAFSHNY